MSIVHMHAHIWPKKKHIDMLHYSITKLWLKNQYDSHINTLLTMRIKNIDKLKLNVLLTLFPLFLKCSLIREWSIYLRSLNRQQNKGEKMRYDYGPQSLPMTPRVTWQCDTSCSWFFQDVPVLPNYQTIAREYLWLRLC